MLSTEFIRGLLYDRKMTQRDLATKLGVHEVTVSRYLSGIRQPNEAMVARMARVLDTVPEELKLEGEDREDPISALARVKYLVKIYTDEWCHNDRLEIVDKLMW